MKPAKLGPFLGENNRLPRHALHVEKTGDFLAATQNVDLDDSGRLSRANGTTLVEALAAGRSGFSANGFSLLADGTDLLSIVSFDPFSAVGVDTVAANPISYAAINDDIFYSDGANLMRLDSLGVANRVGVPSPVFSPAVQIAGDLQQATYLYTMTYFYGDEEGGAAPVKAIDASGGIQITLPTPPAGVTHIGIYCTGPNGDVPLRHSRVAAGTASASITAAPVGAGCRTLNKAPMPVGDHLAHLLDRLLVAAGDTLYYSDPYNFGLTTPAKNYIRFPATITNVVPCKDGAYVTADKTWWITNLNDPLGDPVLPYGAVARSAGALDYENKVFWLSSSGVIVGDALGQVQNVTEKNLMMHISGSGAGLHIDDGISRIVVTNG